MYYKHSTQMLTPGQHQIANAAPQLSAIASEIIRLGGAPLPLNGKMPASGLKWGEMTRQQLIRAAYGVKSESWGFIPAADQFVIDCDTSETIAGLISAFPPALDTFSVQTRRGRHFYFSADTPLPAMSAAGLDVKSGHAYVVAAGSKVVHADGEVWNYTGNRNEIRRLTSAEVERLAAWLEGLQGKPKPKAKPKAKDVAPSARRAASGGGIATSIEVQPDVRLSAWVDAAIDGVLADLRGAVSPGNRHNPARDAIFRLASLANAGLIDPARYQQVADQAADIADRRGKERADLIAGALEKAPPADLPSWSTPGVQPTTSADNGTFIQPTTSADIPLLNPLTVSIGLFWCPKVILGLLKGGDEADGWRGKAGRDAAEQTNRLQAFLGIAIEKSHIQTPPYDSFDDERAFEAIRLISERAPYLLEVMAGKRNPRYVREADAIAADVDALDAPRMNKQGPASILNESAEDRRAARTTAARVYKALYRLRAMPIPKMVAPRLNTRVVRNALFDALMDAGLRDKLGQAAFALALGYASRGALDRFLADRGLDFEADRRIVEMTASADTWREVCQAAKGAYILSIEISGVNIQRKDFKRACQDATPGAPILVRLNGRAKIVESNTPNEEICDNEVNNIARNKVDKVDTQNVNKVDIMQGDKAPPKERLNLYQRLFKRQVVIRLQHCSRAGNGYPHELQFIGNKAWYVNTITGDVAPRKGGTLNAYLDVLVGHERPDWKGKTA